MADGRGPQFHDRRHAGRQLAQALLRSHGELRQAAPVVLALPRGGVPVAAEVAAALDAELDLAMVRKLGAPGREELGIGAVVDGADPQVVVNEETARMVGADRRYIEAETARQLAELERRRKVYRGDAPPAQVRGRTVIVVDDGIATGGTVLAVLRALRKAEPARLILAVPVAPADSLAVLQGECDAIVCVAVPEPFYAVGAHYEDFGQTTDEEVVALLAGRGSRD